MTHTTFDLHTRLDFDIISITQSQNLDDNKIIKSAIIQFPQINTSFITCVNKNNVFSSFHFKSFIEINQFCESAIQLPSGIKRPDEFYFNLTNRIGFIIEKKTQRVYGSTDEKIQTGPFKRYFLQKKFGNSWKINYIYCLSNFFRKKDTELDYLQQQKIPVFWGDCPNYKERVLTFIQAELN